MFKRLSAFFLDILEVIVFAVGLFFFVYLLVMRPHKIKGLSMSPTFPDAEYLLTEKVSYYLNDPQRGDIVVFKPPVSETDEFIKRIIAVPGDRLMIQGGHVFINEERLNERYLADTVVTTDSTCQVGYTCPREGEEYVIPEGQYFVMGDNRSNSSDSRAWGPITKKMMSGKAWFVYWPVNDARVVKAPDYSQK